MLLYALAGTFIIYQGTHGPWAVGHRTRGQRPGRKTIQKDNPYRFPVTRQYRNPWSPILRLYLRYLQRIPIRQYRSESARIAGIRSRPGSTGISPAPGARMISSPEREWYRSMIFRSSVSVMWVPGYNCLKIGCTIALSSTNRYQNWLCVRFILISQNN